MKKSLLYCSIVAALSPLATTSFAAENGADAPETVVVTGTRVKGRTIDDTAVPVDVISNDLISKSGASETGELLQKLAPSFNFSRTTISDGTDIIRPATLRGLGPDQVLILVNGKRRHSQAWVNIQQTVGRGSSGTDINSIPVSAIDRIEVLRDGAAAQYGSDAIAGVINIILKKSTEQTELMARWGQTTEGDGDTLQVAGNTTFNFGEDGYLNLSAEIRDRDATNRAGPSSRKNRVILRLGDSSSENKYFFLNGGVGNFYFFGGLSDREGESGGFYRFEDRADRNVPQVYPDGFLPLQQTGVKDRSFALGFTDFIGDNWEYDISAVYGKNTFEFGVRNSINASYAAEYLANNPGASDTDIAANAGPTSGRSGAINFDQLTFNVDFNGSVDFNDTTLYLATGLEYRDESYNIDAGDVASYSCGRTGNATSPFPSVIDPSATAACGFQGFPGYSPATAARSQRSRDSWAIYLDGETNLTPDFLLGAALRLEDYSDAGNSSTGKLSMRWDATESFAVRGALSTGFRAPSLSQRAFTTVITNVSGTALSQSYHAPDGDAFAAAYGVNGLKHETSNNASLGFVYKPGNGLNVAFDLYQIDIDDRIVLGGALNGVGTDANGNTVTNQAAVNFLTANNYDTGQFFSNAIDTETFGADLVLTYDWNNEYGDFVFTWVSHYNRTEVKSINAPAGVQASTIFPQAQVDNVETGQPRQRMLLGLDWNSGNWATSVKLNRYGKVATSFFTCDGLGIPTSNPNVCGDVLGIDTAKSIKSEGKWLLDLSVSYDFNNGLVASVGGNNVTDQYPTKLPDNAVHRFISDAPGFGNFIYPWESTPFGINGANYYVKFNYKF